MPPRKRELHDRYFKQAKAEGYAARSAYKLKQIQDRRHIIRRGNRVLDLGCAPGSWLQVASELVGDQGVVVGLDLQPVEIDLPVNAHAIVGDVLTFPAETLRGESGIPFDVVLSDMAPNTTGTPGGDHFRSVDLCRRVLEVLPGLLRRGGALAMKVFEGEAYPELLKDTLRVFGHARGFKPHATREVSREMYIMAWDYNG